MLYVCDIIVSLYLHYRIYSHNYSQRYLQCIQKPELNSAGFFKWIVLGIILRWFWLPECRSSHRRCSINKLSLKIGRQTGLRYYGNYHFLKLDFGIWIKIRSVFGVSNLSWWRENVSFTSGNLGFEDKIDDISVCST